MPVTDPTTRTYAELVIRVDVKDPKMIAGTEEMWELLRKLMDPALAETLQYSMAFVNSRLLSVATGLSIDLKGLRFSLE